MTFSNDGAPKRFGVGVVVTTGVPDGNMAVGS